LGDLGRVPETAARRVQADSVWNYSVSRPAFCYGFVLSFVEEILNIKIFSTAAATSFVVLFLKRISKNKGWEVW